MNVDDIESDFTDDTPTTSGARATCGCTPLLVIEVDVGDYACGRCCAPIVVGEDE